MKRGLHILLLFCLSWLTGCVDEPVFQKPGEGIVLTVCCEEPLLTKTDKAGEQQYNENLIKTVDFLFYPGNQRTDVDAVYHIRRDLSEDPTQDGNGTAQFSIVVNKEVFQTIFASNNEATVYALVNFTADDIAAYLGNTLEDTSLDDLYAKDPIETDFAANERNFIQPSFLMHGMALLEYDGNNDLTVSGTVSVKRLAAKLTLGVNVVTQVELNHQKVGDEEIPSEIWEPVLHSMNAYLVDGVKTIKLSGIDDSNNPGKFFSYRGNDNKRPYAKEDESPLVGKTTVGEDQYYETYPMYSYPRNWTNEKWNYSQINFKDGLPPEQPYIKLEMDWRRKETHGYSYDRRKYYYKVFLPFDSFESNHWYAMYLNVSILGAETDEGKAIATPSCYVLDWQNNSMDINKAAVISKARFLSLDRNDIILRNQDSVEISFLSSHNVKIVPGSVKATRPFYGTVDATILTEYNTKMHAWVGQVAGSDKYYLDYRSRNGIQDDTTDPYDPFNWITTTPTSIKFMHVMQNDYTKDDFDYSPYTITFQVVHSDLVAGDLFNQYVRTVTIEQYPAIYIEATRNRDIWITATGNSDCPYDYRGTIYADTPLKDQPWGFVFVDGQDGRNIRVDKKTSNSKDPFFTLKNNDDKREYQWRTVWYTGGSKDMFKINVTVLPKSSNLIIGDPRVDEVDNLNYSFRVHDERDRGLVVDRDSFAVARFVGGAPNEARSLRHYYPTEESIRTENMLAPSFRIASKFGGTEYGGSFFGDITKEFARYRCAAYQEDGFPAGRWRLPTKGEILFIAQLSAKGAFEPLFSFRSTYWSANGPIKVNTGSVSNSDASTALLRCVYDSWYWGDTQYDKEVFLWGDQPR